MWDLYGSDGWQDEVENDLEDIDSFADDYYDFIERYGCIDTDF